MRRSVLPSVLAASLLAVPFVVVPPSRALRPALADDCHAQILTTLPTGAHGTTKWPLCGGD